MILLGCTVVLLVGAIAVFSILLVRTAEARRAPKTTNCYFCGNSALRRSAPHPWIDPLLAYWNCAPHRCDVCYRRQYRYLAAKQSAED